MNTPIQPGEGVHDPTLLAFVDAYWKLHFQPPPIRDIAKACNTSTSVVIYTLKRFWQAGIFTKQGNKFIPVWVVEAIKGNHA